MMYFKIFQIIMALVFWMLRVLFYRLFGSILYAILFLKIAVAVKRRLSNLYCVSAKKPVKSSFRCDFLCLLV